MADIQQLLSCSGGGKIQINASVPSGQAQEVADALEFLMMRNIHRSKSSWVVESILEYAESLGFERAAGKEG